MNIYLDIETIPTQRDDIRDEFHDKALEEARNAPPPGNYKKEEAIAKWRAGQVEAAPGKADELWRKTALDGGWGEIVVLGSAVDASAINIDSRGNQVATEETLIRQFWSSLAKQVGQQRAVFVGHCIEFDLRFLHHRSVIHGIRPTVHLPYNSAPWRGDYVDTMYEWCGQRGSVKLTTLCRMLDIPVSDHDIDGSQVWDAWREGRVSEVEEHCMLDVERVRQIHRRLRWSG